MTVNKDSLAPFKSYAANWILSSLDTTSKDSVTQDPQKELLDYVQSPREVAPTWTQLSGGVYVFLFWLKFTSLNYCYMFQYHSQQYPTLSHIAHDYLAIQGSSVSSEQAFSSSGLTDTLHCNQMDPFLFGQVQIAKGGYKSGLVDASADAAAHRVCEYIQIS